MATIEKICPTMSRADDHGILHEAPCLRERCGCWKIETFGPGQSFGSCGLVHESP